MTVSYTDNVIKLLLRWKGSVWKSVWKELLIWLTFYYLIRVVLTFYVDNTSPYLRIVNGTIEVFHNYTTDFPLDFFTSFYVAQVLIRWWNQILMMPWPDELMSLVLYQIDGSDERSALIRYTIGRYLVLTQVLAMRNISVNVRKRFPTIQHVLGANLMTRAEHRMYESAPVQLQWHLPLCWIQSIITEDAKDKRGNTLPPQFQTNMMQEINKFRTSLRTLCMYCWMAVPLTYTQATGVGLYGYFALCLIGEQSRYELWLKPAPVTLMLRFLFYVGWYKVAQELMKPFDDGDEDVETNYLLDRHWRFVQSLAKFSPTEPSYPALMQDKFYDDTHVPPLQDTKMSAEITEQPPVLHSRFKAKEHLLVQQSQQAQAIIAISERDDEHLLYF